MEPGLPPLPELLRERLDPLARQLQPARRKPKQTTGETTYLVPEKGGMSQIKLREMDGGKDVTYILAINSSFAESEGEPATWQPVQETLGYRHDVAGTDLIYDLTGEFLQGKARPFECDLSRLPVRLYAALPFQVERTVVAAEQRVVLPGPAADSKPGQIRVRVEFQDGGGQTIVGAMPFHLSLVAPQGDSLEIGYYSTSRDGRFNALVSLPKEVTVGTWSLVVRCQLRGEETTLPVEFVEADKARPVGNQKVKLTSEGLQRKDHPRSLALDPK